MLNKILLYVFINLNFWYFWSYFIFLVYFFIFYDGNFFGYIDVEFFEFFEVVNLIIINVYKFIFDMFVWIVIKEGLNDFRL